MSDNTILETPDFDELPPMPEMPYIPPSPPRSSQDGDPGRDWMAIVSLVAAVLSLCGIVFIPIGCFFSLAAVILGILGLKSTQKTLAIIGLVIGGIGILIALIFGLIVLLAMFTTTGAGIGDVFSGIVTDLESGY